MVSATAFACANCRITPGHHKYFPSSGSAESYFTGKKKIDFGNVTIVRSPESKHGYNVGACHVQSPLSALENCDYFCFKNSTSSVMFINRITMVEYVNENSSRIHYTIDHYATYVGYLKLGWAFVERTHVPDYTDITQYMLPEPINVPKNVYTKPTPVLAAAWDAIHNKDNWVYAIYMTSDEKGNANSGDVRIRQISGSPFYGKFFAVKTSAEVETVLKSYLNQAGYLVDSVNPTVSNICKIIFCPKELTTEGIEYFHNYQEPIVLPPQTWPKALAPQFVKFRLVAKSSGATLDFDVTKASISVQTGLSFGFSIRGVGGTNPVMGMTLDMPLAVDYVGGLGGSVTSGLINIMQLGYPQLPIATFMNQEVTPTGFAKNIVGGAIKGAMGGAITGMIAGPEGIAAGAAVGALGGAINGLSREENSFSNYTMNSSPSSEYAYANVYYDFELAIEMPTTEGFKVLEAFFNSFGYNVSRRQQLNLAVRGNFTYIKTAGGITATSDTAPQYSIDQIGLMFDQGLTVWSAEIGSTESCG